MSKPVPLDPQLLELDLPDPFQEGLSNIEFNSRLEKAWTICDRFDLQTEIWRGRILRVIRDREKSKGEGRGAGFLEWLREREISKTKAYGLIQLADSADDLVVEGLLDQSSVNNFSKRAFVETANSSPEVQQIISQAANEGQEITRRQVKRLSDEFASSTSHLLPDEVRERTQANLLPPRIVAPLVKELSKLPEVQQDDMRELLRKEPEINCIKDMTLTARWMSKSLDASLSLRALKDKEVNLEKAMQEAQRIEVLGLLSDALAQAQSIESAVIKLHTAWRRLGSLDERLWVESGSSTPYLKEILNVLQSLNGATIRVSLGELSGGKNVRLQMVEESPDQLLPPDLN